MNELTLLINYWHWVGLAAIIFIFEVLTGTGFLLWIGISAMLVGIILFLFPMIILSAQLLIFAILALTSALAWRMYLNYYPIKTANPTLNRRAEQYIGRVFVLKSPIVNGMGKIHVDDTMWLVKCDKDLPEGKRVKVIAAEGVILVVQ